MAYVHDLDPFLWQIYGDFGIRWYGLSYLAGFFFSYLIISWLSQRQKTGMTPALVSEFIMYGAIGALVGGRLGYCLFYEPDLFLKFNSDFPFWGALAVNRGGMASHGGIIGVVVACFLFSRRFGVNLQYLFDLVALSAPLGLMMGRIANFINGELVGRPAAESFPLAVKFPQDIFGWPYYDSQRLYSLSPVVEKLGVQASDWNSWIPQFATDAVARTNIQQNLSSIVNAIQNGNVEVKTAIAPLLLARHPSQLYGAVLEGLLVFVVLFLFWRKPRKPGTVGALMFILYAIGRIIGENFRLPDAHIGLQALDLSRGQWLSVGLFVVGFTFFIIWWRSNSLPINGWGRDSSVRLGRR